MNNNTIIVNINTMFGSMVCTEGMKLVVGNIYTLNSPFPDVVKYVSISNQNTSCTISTQQINP